LLLRKQDGDLIAIGQSSHSWISGQLARAWGNPRFGGLEPYEEVSLAAEQHDIGMSLWDLSPSRDPSTGFPQSFMEMALDTHLRLWSAAPQRLLTQSRYAALLVSMHGCRLYEMRDLDRLRPSEAQAVRAYLQEQRSFQQEVLVSLRSDPAVSGSATPELLARNSQLIWTWDYLSLALCLDWAPCTLRAVPSAAGPVDLELSGQPGHRRLGLDPWPFCRAEVIVRCEGRRLTQPSETDEAMRKALAGARSETVVFELSAREP
jgi:hypothetical protein